MREFKVGDVVRVTNWSKQYSTCTPWFTKHEDELELAWMINYRYGNFSKNSDHNPNERFKVLFVDQNKGRCLIGEMVINMIGGTYLIDEDGLAHVRKRMTQDDIEMALGYRVELIGEWSNE